MAEPQPEQVVVGRIAGAYGVRGWVRVTSFTEPPDNILAYGPWRLRHRGKTIEAERLEGRRHGRGVIARLAGIVDREAAAALRGAEVSVGRGQLPPAEDDTYYWADLEGLAVVNTAGVHLGRVERLMETGANDVLVIQGERERLVPFVQGEYVHSVDLQAGTIVVAWDEDF